MTAALRRPSPVVYAYIKKTSISNKKYILYLKEFEKLERIEPKFAPVKEANNKD